MTYRTMKASMSRPARLPNTMPIHLRVLRIMGVSSRSLAAPNGFCDFALSSCRPRVVLIAYQSSSSPPGSLYFGDCGLTNETYVMATDTQLRLSLFAFVSAYLLPSPHGCKSG